MRLVLTASSLFSFLSQANALHHRSDSLSSAVTFLAIGGSWLGFPVLDPLGGLLVAGLIGKQGADLLIGALGELSDKGVEPSVLHDFDSALQRVKHTEGDILKGWKDLRAVKSGVSTFVDVTLQMPQATQLAEARLVESIVRKEITGSQKGVSIWQVLTRFESSRTNFFFRFLFVLYQVKEVRVHLDTVEGDL